MRDRSLGMDEAAPLSAAQDSIWRCWKSIGSDQDDSVLAVVAMPMNGFAGFSDGVTRMKRHASAVVTGDDVDPLHEINHGRPVLVAMHADVSRSARSSARVSRSCRPAVASNSGPRSTTVVLLAVYPCCRLERPGHCRFARPTPGPISTSEAHKRCCVISSATSLCNDRDGTVICQSSSKPTHPWLYF